MNSSSLTVVILALCACFHVVKILILYVRVCVTNLYHQIHVYMYQYNIYLSALLLWKISSLKTNDLQNLWRSILTTKKLNWSWAGNKELSRTWIIPLYHTCYVLMSLGFLHFPVVVNYLQSQNTGTCKSSFLLSFFPCTCHVLLCIWSIALVCAGRGITISPMLTSSLYALGKRP